MFFALFAVWCKIGRQMPLQIKGQVGRVDNSTGARSKNRWKYQLPLQMHVLAHTQFENCQKKSFRVRKAYLAKSLKCTLVNNVRRREQDLISVFAAKDRPGQEGLSISVLLPMYSNFRGRAAYIHCSQNTAALGPFFFFVPTRF